MYLTPNVAVATTARRLLERAAISPRMLSGIASAGFDGLQKLSKPSCALGEDSSFIVGLNIAINTSITAECSFELTDFIDSFGPEAR